MKSQQIHLISRPTGLPTADNFKSVEITLPAPGQGEVLVKNTWMSVDPYMRPRMIDRESYIPPFQLDEVLEGGAIGEVIESNNSNFPVGTKVSHLSGWRTSFISDGTDLTVLPDIEVPEQLFLGTLGMPGLTAWAGLTKVIELKESDTIFVSAASGAVGSIVCQIAKLKGCKVIASVGSDEKAEFVKALGVDAVINYKKVDNLTEALEKAAPEGIDVYFENVGGEHLEAALNVMNDYGRIPVCGMISSYNADKPTPGPSNLFFINSKKLTVQGFIVIDYFDCFPEFVAQMANWMAEGKIKSEETIYHGLDNAVDAFIGLFEGKNKGKMLVKL
ncbi:NADP-dependent oxidoreductase [Thalassotalea mangrovi]|uniref:NADP-dependent oxidoreductase n=1 Tax=Thalassotalea mangrovi TaxID=2572245 RepID=A0A4U1B311_9GAMM|nr:NADP-dependent oxidoreductase [Thalassotalea mangrovi]TKB43761.1 NADP-dependent oxidoreductase [Thalassotalea mangrovi]